MESAQGVTRIHFEAFEADLETGELRRHGLRLNLPDQSFQILAMLLMRPGKLVSREEIQRHLWPNDTVVEFEAAINGAVRRLRMALNDSAEDPHFIETLPRRGYRWIAPAEWVTSGSSGSTRDETPASPLETRVMVGALLGQKVSHYRVIEILGAGGMGVVYGAEDLKLGRRVALKFLPEELREDRRALERFEREARAASALNHPNICVIHDWDENQNHPFLVMELLEGETLRERMARAPRRLRAETPGGAGASGPQETTRALPVGEVLDFALQIASGLDAAHRQGIIHRDIKPANIFITAQNVVKILDFGLAKLAPAGMLRGVDPECRRRDHHDREDEAVTLSGSEASQDVRAAQGGTSEGKAAADPRLTQTGAAMGTAPYMSPEQVRGERLDARTDLFSFGAVLYEMATGRPAFGGEAVAAVRQSILNEEPQSASLINPEISPTLGAVIDKALQKNRELRYQSAADLRADLERAKSDAGADGVRPVEGSARGAPPAESERRSPLRSHWKPVIAAVAAMAVAAGVYLYIHSRSAAKLNVKDTVVLADFTNTTGDPVFDGALRQGLSAQLQQSPFLNLLSDSRIARTLAEMGQPKDERLTPDVVREVCQRRSGAATIEGSVASLGSQYVVGLQAVDCRNGNMLADEQASAGRKEQVLHALAVAATRMRRELGESLASVQKYDVPLEEATTPSLDALKAYSLGVRAQVLNSDWEASIPLFQRAVSLDPNFAMAWSVLANAYRNLGETARAAEAMNKAYDLRNRVSARERFVLESSFEFLVIGDLDAARRVNESNVQEYPRAWIPYVQLTNIYNALGENEKMLAAAQNALKMNPTSGTLYANLLVCYLNLNRLDEAKATAQEAQARKLDSPLIHLNLYFVDFLRHDTSAMETEAAGLMGKPGYEDVMLYEESDGAAYAGQYAKARDLTRRAAASAERVDEKETAAEYEAEAAVREVLVGNRRLARQQAQAALKLSTDSDTEAMSAIALGLAGDSTQATRLADHLDGQFPKDTAVQFSYVPMIRAASALGRGGGPPGAHGALHALATTYDLAIPHNLRVNFCPYPVYLRGEAYLAERQGTEAAAEFQKVLDHPGLVVNQPIGALAHLGLGRAYALEAEVYAGRELRGPTSFARSSARPPAPSRPGTERQRPEAAPAMPSLATPRHFDALAKARIAYRDFLALWKDADSDLPILKQAKAEYAKLK